MAHSRPLATPGSGVGNTAGPPSRGRGRGRGRINIPQGLDLSPQDILNARKLEPTDLFPPFESMPEPRIPTDYEKACVSNYMNLLHDIQKQTPYRVVIKSELKEEGIYILKS